MTRNKFVIKRVEINQLKKSVYDREKIKEKLGKIERIYLNQDKKILENLEKEFKEM